MTEQFLQRFEDARPRADVPLRQPLVSLEDMQQFQRHINDRGRANLPASVNVNYIDFGLPGNLYSTQSSPDVHRVQHGDQRPDAPEFPLSGQTLEQRGRLLQEVERMPAHLRNAVRRDIETLESRDRQPPLSAEQLRRLYNATANLLINERGTSPLPRADRQLLVAGIIDNAAHPRDIDQGNFSTCNVTTIEERLYTLNPERAAELVAQVGLTGRYRAPDGFAAQLDRRNLRPDAESRIPPSSPQADGRRNFASQIFSVAVINDHWQRSHPEARYVQRPARNSQDTGEALMLGNRLMHRAPNIDISGMNQIGQRLGFDRGFIWGSHTARDVHEKDGTVVIRTRQDLQERLEQTQGRGGFPIIIGVEADGPMFGNRRPLRGPQGHVINTVGYDAERRTVRISDQYGRRSDLPNVGIDDLYLSMIPRRLRPQN